MKLSKWCMYIILSLMCGVGMGHGNTFECRYENDIAPPITEEAETLFQEARKLRLARGIPDTNKIRMYHRRAMKLGHWKAQYNIAMEIFSNRMADDSERQYAYDLIKDLVDREIPLGVYGMAQLLRDGEFVQRDVTMASQYMHRAAELGSPQAQYYLGSQADNRMNLTLAKAYLRCSLDQGYKDAGYLLGNIASSAEENYVKAARYYLAAASLAHKKSLVYMISIFRSGPINREFGYHEDRDLAKCFSNKFAQLSDQPHLTFPNLAEECPLPIHPIMGDEKYPDLEMRDPGFLDRLREKGHDPEWEEREGNKRINRLRGHKAKQATNEYHRTTPREKIRPSVPDLESWIAPHVQVGEFFVKYQGIYLHLINRGLEKKIESPYLIATMDTFHLDYIPVEQFHEQTEGQFRLWLSQKG